MSFQVFCQMIKANIKIELSYLKSVLSDAITELQINQKKMLAAKSIDEKVEVEV